MSFRLRHPAREDEDWVIVAEDWWRTSFQDVPWSYVSRSAAKSQRKSFHGSLFCNPHSRMTTSSMSKEHRTPDENDSINAELVGVKNALEVVAGYERDVGFYFTTLPDLPSHDVPAVDLNIKVDEKRLGEAKKYWDDQLEDLMNGTTGEDSDDSSLSSSGELHRSTSMFSSMSSIDSIGMPSTPKPKSFFSEIEIKVASPPGSIDYNLSPTRSLNAAASSFIPTFCPQLNDEPLQFPTLEERPKPAADPLANYTFPTLNLHSPTIKVKKDDTQPVSEAQDTRNDLLPPFLQDSSIRTRTRKSRTREIVDRLRSRMDPQEDSPAPQPQFSPKYASHSPSPTVGDKVKLLTPRLSVSEDGGDRLPSPCEEDDGWMDASQSTVMSPNNKSKRARELLFALTRRRTDSLPSETAKEKEMTPAASETSIQNTSPSPSPSPSPPLLTSIDGWIESSPKRPSEPQKKVNKPLPTPNQNPNHNRKKSSNHVSRTSTSSQSHPHSHSHQTSYSHPYSHPQYGSSSPGYSPHPVVALPNMLSTPMLPGGQALPYFFPTYPNVNIPMQYTAFMQMPAYHLGVAMQQQQPIVGGPNPAMQYTLSPPMGVPLRTGSSMKPPTSAATVGNLNIPPAFRSKHSPVW